MSKPTPTPKCPVCGDPNMIWMPGVGWDYDRWLCGRLMPGRRVLVCDGEIELETTTYPEEETNGGES
jgi:hypothetical protein